MPKWTEQLPPQCQTLALEIYAALSDSPCLAAIGARTLIDVMLTDMLGDIGGFEQKLLQAVRGGLLTDEQHHIIAAAVQAGHAASHRGYTPTPQQLSQVLDIVEHALQARYVMRPASQHLAEQIPQRKRPGAD